jgi:hypothetical protein
MYGQQFLHCFLHEGQQTDRMMSVSLSAVGLQSQGYTCHLDLPPGSGCTGIEVQLSFIFTLVSPFLRAMKAARESRGISLLCFLTLAL